MRLRNKASAVVGVLIGHLASRWLLAGVDRISGCVQVSLGDSSFVMLDDN